MDDPRQRNILIGVVVVIVLVAAGLVVAVLGRSGDDTDTVSSTSTSTSPTTSSTTSTSLPPSTTTTVSAADLDLAVYPDLTTGPRFDEPTSLVEAFATDRLGFDTDVVIGPLQQGDARSGEIEIHPAKGTAITTVAVRQLADDSWVIVAVSTDSIRLTTPIARTKISTPQPLLGQAYAFEGHVDVLLYADGQDVPLATGTVMGRGDGVLGAFSGQLEFDVPAGVTHGILVLTSPNGDDGTSVAAVAVRVAF